MLRPGLPFPVIADPRRLLYAEFGVARSRATGRRPHNWRAVAAAVGEGYGGAAAFGWGEQHGGLPADVLVRPDGRVVAVRYGRHVDDHWSVDELLHLAASRRAAG